MCNLCAICCILALGLYNGQITATTHSPSLHPFSPPRGGLVFVAPPPRPTRINESHVSDGEEKSQSRDTAVEGFLMNPSLTLGGGMQW